MCKFCIIMVNKYVENTPNMVFGILTLNWVDESSPCSRVSYLHIDKVKMEKSSNREEKYIQRCKLLKTSRKITKKINIWKNLENGSSTLSQLHVEG